MASDLFSLEGDQVSRPIVFVSRNKIKEGKADEFREHYRDSVSPIVAGKPGTLAQLAYEAEEAAEVVIVRLFPDADALDLQMEGADERSKKTYEFIEPTSIEIFGKPNSATLERMKRIAGSGVAVRISPNYLGGFIR
jgi:quinol monooxygenase YgiN